MDFETLSRFTQMEERIKFLEERVDVLISAEASRAYAKSWDGSSTTPGGDEDRMYNPNGNEYG